MNNKQHETPIHPEEECNETMVNLSTELSPDKIVCDLSSSGK
jgi:hypothetical protein